MAPSRSSNARWRVDALRVTAMALWLAELFNLFLITFPFSDVFILLFVIVEVRVRELVAEGMSPPDCGNRAFVLSSAFKFIEEQVNAESAMMGVRTRPAWDNLGSIMFELVEVTSVRVGR